MKKILFIIFCIILLVAIYIIINITLKKHRRINKLYLLGCQNINSSFDHHVMTKKDYYFREEIRKNFRLNKTQKANDLIAIRVGEVELSVITPSETTNTNIFASLKIHNISSRDIVIFEPDIKRVTAVSAVGGDFLYDIYFVECMVNFSKWCKVLKPGDDMVIHDVLLTFNGIGFHKIDFSFRVPVYQDISSNHISTKNVEVATACCIFFYHTP